MLQMCPTRWKLSLVGLPKAKVVLNAEEPLKPLENGRRMIVHSARHCSSFSIVTSMVVSSTLNNGVHA